MDQSHPQLGAVDTWTPQATSVLQKWTMRHNAHPGAKISSAMEAANAVRFWVLPLWNTAGKNENCKAEAHQEMGQSLPVPNFTKQGTHIWHDTTSYHFSRIFDFSEEKSDNIPLFQEGFGQNRQATVDAKQQNSCDLHDFSRHMRWDRTRDTASIRCRNRKKLTITM